MEPHGGLIDGVLVTVAHAGADPFGAVGIAGVRTVVVDLHPAACADVEAAGCRDELDLEFRAETLPEVRGHVHIPVRFDRVGIRIEFGGHVIVSRDEIADGPDQVRSGDPDLAGLVPGAGATGAGAGGDFIDDAAGEERQGERRDSVHGLSRIPTPAGRATKNSYSWT